MVTGKTPSPMTESNKRALVVAFFLSKFDKNGAKLLGYDSFNAAFRGVSEILSIPSATIKLMRDEFDPYCSKVRVGWYQRDIIRSRLNVIEAYDDLSEYAMLQIAKLTLHGTDTQISQILSPIDSIDDGNRILISEENPYATRLRTGDKAEEFFFNKFDSFAQFSGCQLEDTRKFGIGFDFKANYSTSYWAIEVKGLNEKHGYVAFTDKEWAVAQVLKSSYYLALVRSLKKTPYIELIQNPANALDFQMRTSQAIQVNWVGRL